MPANFGSQAVTLDGGGRVTSFKGATLKYNGRGGLFAVERPITNGTETETYGYDASMRRVARIHTTNVNGTLTVTAEEYYVYNGANLVATLDKTGAVKQSYLYAGVDEPLRLKTNNAADLYFYEVDLAGNVRRVMGWAGSDQGGYRYSAFGIPYAPDAQSPQAQIDQPLRWKGRPYSDFSGLYDMRARQWSPELGTFTSIDEHVFHDTSSTLWGWPNQSPTRYRDPSGHFAPSDPVLLDLPAAVPAAGSASPAALAGGALLGAAIEVGAIFVIMKDIDDFNHPVVYSSNDPPNPAQPSCPAATGESSASPPPEPAPMAAAGGAAGRRDGGADGSVVSSTLPSWVRNGGTVVNYARNLQREFLATGIPVSQEQADDLVRAARAYGVDIRLDSPHRRTRWNVPHLNVGPDAHVAVPDGYVLPP